MDSSILALTSHIEFENEQWQIAFGLVIGAIGVTKLLERGFTNLLESDSLTVAEKTAVITLML